MVYIGFGTVPSHRIHKESWNDSLADKGERYTNWHGEIGKLTPVRNFGYWEHSASGWECWQSHRIPYVCTFTTQQYSVWLCRWLVSRQWRTLRGLRRLQTDTTWKGEINRGQAEEKTNYFYLWWKKMKVVISLSSSSDSKLFFFIVLFSFAETYQIFMNN